jgi:FkbM family methyltransferase
MNEGDPALATEWLFRTPAGNNVVYELRPGTSDWNTANACTEVGNEYALPTGMTGWALDVGAHIGAVAVAYLIDNPQAHMVAVEALPENVDYIYRNLRRNGLETRAVVFNRAASNLDHGTTWIGYGEVRDPTRIHEFIGNANAPGDSRGIDVLNINLRRIRETLFIDEFEWMKIDCEGCEYPLFAEPEENAHIRTIVGEVHYGAKRLHMVLNTTHDLQADADFGPFWAQRKGTEWPHNAPKP